MKNSLAGSLEAGSFIAGILIGLSVLIPVFAMMVVDPGTWQALWAVGAAIILAIGLALQVVITSKPSHWRTAEAELEAWPQP